MLALLICLYWSDFQVVDALRSASKQCLDQIAARIDKMACAGGVDVLIGSLKPTIDEPMMTELIARCTERR
jgi:hypothetical protein